jgi:hypothetical protein
LSEHKITSDQFALAYELKNDLKDLIRTKFDMDVFTENTEEKTILRPLLVAYGDVTRSISKGTWWTQKVEPRVIESKADIVFITDIRYDHYQYDECDWLQRHMRGKLVHITKYKIQPVQTSRHLSDGATVKVYDGAPNDNEMLNNPKLKMRADYAFEWENYAKGSPENCEYIREKVTEALKALGVLT